MEKRKKLLWFSLLTVSLIGIGFLLGMFGSALKPPANAGELSPSIDIADLEPGEILTRDVNYDAGGKWGFRYIIYKNYESEITVFGVPLREGMVNMPDITWWRWGTECRNFGPTMKNGKVVPQSQFKCHDHELNTWFAKENVWDLEGNNLGKYTEDMERVRFSIKGFELILHMYY
ncbi:hypothetical protein MJO52_00780 [Microbulbifer variabilis]|uniref:Uncharacterized protein n=1 Tax=Microbulbifer variabilis TaxID=266805 RepID=A0ABY4VBP7_9GAMM|nr:hypothetical protein [Microbulbifer variabilis]USD21709.1 hypothetical protein MJO52_00780 [Microbulbifer variabilis]